MTPNSQAEYLQCIVSLVNETHSLVQLSEVSIGLLHTPFEALQCRLHHIVLQKSNIHRRTECDVQLHECVIDKGPEHGAYIIVWINCTNETAAGLCSN